VGHGALRDGRAKASLLPVAPVTDPALPRHRRVWRRCPQAPWRRLCRGTRGHARPGDRCSAAASSRATAGRQAALAASLASVLAATVDVIPDRHFLEGRGLIPRQGREIEIGVGAVLVPVIGWWAAGNGRMKCSPCKCGGMEVSDARRLKALKARGDFRSRTLLFIEEKNSEHPRSGPGVRA
jgi:hypothetical protein